MADLPKLTTQRGVFDAVARWLETKGRAVADAIPDCEWIPVEGLGHDLPEGLWPTLVDAVALTTKGGHLYLFDEEGNAAKGEGGGFLVLKHPWPGMLRGIWGDPKRFKETLTRAISGALLIEPRP